MLRRRGQKNVLPPPELFPSAAPVRQEQDFDVIYYMEYIIYLVFINYLFVNYNLNFCGQWKKVIGYYLVLLDLKYRTYFKFLDHECLGAPGDVDGDRDTDCLEEDQGKNKCPCNYKYSDKDKGA